MVHQSSRQRHIASLKFVQTCFGKLALGLPLTHEEATKLIASHEELRGMALVARERNRHLERENEALLDTVKTMGRNLSVPTQNASRTFPRPSARAKPRNDDDEE